MPFSRTTASADTCVLSDFIAADQPGLLLRLFPDGIWVDPSVIVELEERFGPDIRARIAAGGLTLLVERDYAASDYAEMAEIKRTRPAMRHPDIASVVLARKIGGTCLSSDGAVRKTCVERQIRIAGQLGCLCPGRSNCKGATHPTPGWRSSSPGLGWVDCDATNDLVPGEQHITTALGHDYQDVTPLDGVFCGGGATAMGTRYPAMWSANSEAIGSAATWPKVLDGRIARRAATLSGWPFPARGAASAHRATPGAWRRLPHISSSTSTTTARAITTRCRGAKPPLPGALPVAMLPASPTPDPVGAHGALAEHRPAMLNSPRPQPRCGWISYPLIIAASADLLGVIRNR